jgi:hypothetical protein
VNDTVGAMAITPIRGQILGSRGDEATESTVANPFRLRRRTYGRVVPYAVENSSKLGGPRGARAQEVRS